MVTIIVVAISLVATTIGLLNEKWTFERLHNNNNSIGNRKGLKSDEYGDDVHWPMAKDNTPNNQHMYTHANVVFVVFACESVNECAFASN